MTPSNFNWFLHTMLFYHTRYLLEKQKQKFNKTDNENRDEDENEDEDEDEDEINVEENVHSDD